MSLFTLNIAKHNPKKDYKLSGGKVYKVYEHYCKVEIPTLFEDEAVEMAMVFKDKFPTHRGFNVKLSKVVGHSEDIPLDDE